MALSEFKGFLVLLQKAENYKRKGSTPAPFELFLLI